MGWRDWVQTFVHGSSQRSSSLSEPQFWLKDALGGSASSTGAVVTERTALGNAAVYSCVRVLADSVAQLPLKLYRLKPNGGKDEDRRHPLWSILHDLPNPELTSFELKQTLQGHLCLWGNAYAEIEREPSGRIVGLWPLRPDRMQVERLSGGGKVWKYEMASGERVAFPWSAAGREPAPILHLRGLSADGLMGLSPLTLLRDAIGLTLASEENAAQLYANNSRPSGVLQSPGRITKESAERLREGWERAHKGLSKAHRVAVLEEGVTWHQVGMSAEDSQLLESRKFQVTEIARAFRVPPHMIADLERATFSNIEHQAIDFVVHSLTPWLVCWEQAIARDVLSAKAFETHQVRFVVAGLLRGDMASRYAGYATGRQWGWLSADDVRALEDQNPLPKKQGQIYLTPANMSPADAAPVAPMPVPEPMPEPMDDAEPLRLVI